MRGDGPPALDTYHGNGETAAPGLREQIVAGGQQIQKVGARHLEAVRITEPRAIDIVKKNVCREAELCGDDFFYAWEVKTNDGPKIVEGISIDGAAIMARLWGNCILEVTEDAEGPQHWNLNATFVDLETGFHANRLFRQRKGQTGGKMDADRALDIDFQIGQSKAQRNVVVKFMPVWLKTAAMEAAKAAAFAALDDTEKLKKAVESLTDRYAMGDITVEDLERKLGERQVEEGESNEPVRADAWTPRDIVTLNGIWKAVRDRMTTWKAEFPWKYEAAQDATETTTEQPHAVDDTLLDMLTLCLNEAIVTRAAKAMPEWKPEERAAVYAWAEATAKHKSDEAIEVPECPDAISAVIADQVMDEGVASASGADVPGPEQPTLAGTDDAKPPSSKPKAKPKARGKAK